MFNWKEWSLAPRVAVTSSMIWSVWSICIWSFARPCQVASKKRSLSTLELCGSGKSLLKTGMAHWDFWVPISQALMKEDNQTWRRSLKSLAAIFFISEVLRKTANNIVTKAGYLMIAVFNNKIWISLCKWPYHWSSLLSKFSFRLSRIQRRWMKIAFQTPSSNSCSRSTTRAPKSLKSIMWSFSQKAFSKLWDIIMIVLESDKKSTYWGRYQWLTFKEWFNLGIVDHIILLIDHLLSGFNVFLSFLNVGMDEGPSLKSIALCAQITCLWEWNQTARTRASSQILDGCDQDPIWHNAWDRLVIESSPVLLWVVSRVSEILGIEVSRDPITALDDDPMHICM